MTHVKKYLTLALILFTVLGASAQNIVVNPGFESIQNCPTFGLPFDSVSVGWKNLSGNPGIMAACNSGIYGVPSNGFGYEPAHGGSNYALLTCGGSKDYISSELLQPMMPGEEYSISFFVSFADSSANTSNPNIEVAFSTTPNMNTIGWNVVGQSTQSIVSGWEKMKLTFIADSIYKYIAFGKFAPDSSDHFTNVCPSCYVPSPTYYLDDIDVGSTATSILDDVVRKAAFYPNPAKDWIEFQSDWEMISANGSVIAKGKRGRHYVGDLPRGAYYIRSIVCGGLAILI